MINAISIVGASFKDVPSKVSEITGRFGKKPDYIVVDESQHSDMLEMDSSKTKGERVIKFKGMSVVIVPSLVN